MPDAFDTCLSQWIVVKEGLHQDLGNIKNIQDYLQKLFHLSNAGHEFQRMKKLKKIIRCVLTDPVIEDIANLAGEKKELRNFKTWFICFFEMKMVILEKFCGSTVVNHERERLQKLQA